MPVGPTIIIVVVPFHMVGALRFVVVLPVAVVVLVVVAVSGPRAIVRIVVVFLVAVAVAIVAVVLTVVVVISALPLLDIDAPTMSNGTTMMVIVGPMDMIYQAITPASPAITGIATATKTQQRTTQCCPMATYHKLVGITIGVIGQTGLFSNQYEQ